MKKKIISLFLCITLVLSADCMVMATEIMPYSEKDFFSQTVHVGNLSDQVGFTVSGTVIYRPGGYVDIEDINISTFGLCYIDSYRIVSKSDTYFTLSVQGGYWPAGQEDSHPNAINMTCLIYV